MNIKLFYHSLVSDWNHGNAHFLRGVTSELLSRKHSVTVYEPEDGWSRQNLVADYGKAPLNAFKKAYPELKSQTYRLQELDLDKELANADLVIAHEWSDPELITRLGDHRAKHDYALLFHDTHHRGVTRPEEMERYDLKKFDGVLAFGKVLSEIYEKRGWCNRVWTFHEAADTRRFYPRKGQRLYDVVWIGNWGDNERTEELVEFLLEPIRELGLKAKIWGVRYPPEALELLKNAGIDYGGWLPNHRAPEIFSQARMTVHVPRRPYVQSLPGIPTIRPFEAMACGIPLICSPWNDAEHLFQGGDYLQVEDSAEMKRAMRRILQDPESADKQARQARETILSRHTCSHRVDELMEICRELGVRGAESSLQSSSEAEAVA